MVAVPKTSKLIRGVDTRIHSSANPPKRKIPEIAMRTIRFLFDEKKLSAAPSTTFTPVLWMAAAIFSFFIVDEWRAVTVEATILTRTEVMPITDKALFIASTSSEQSAPEIRKIVSVSPCASGGKESLFSDLAVLQQ
jgi:hypothetical protein